MTDDQAFHLLSACRAFERLGKEMTARESDPRVYHLSPPSGRCQVNNADFDRLLAVIADIDAVAAP